VAGKRRKDEGVIRGSHKYACTIYKWIRNATRTKQDDDENENENENKDEDEDEEKDEENGVSPQGPKLCAINYLSLVDAVYF